MKKHTLMAMFASVCALTACGQMSSFTPKDCDVEDKIIQTDGYYYQCKNKQLKLMNYVPECTGVGDTRFREYNNICYEEYCSDDYIWRLDQEKNKLEPVSCKSEGGSLEKGECINGTVDCTDDNLKICGSGQLQTVDESVGHCSCKQDMPCMTMNGNVGFVCVNENLVACPEGRACNADGKCGECRIGEIRPNNKTIDYCKDGKWVSCEDKDSDKTICETYCRDENALECSEDLQAQKICNGMNWVTRPCQTGNICKEGLGCVPIDSPTDVCVDGDKDCTGDESAECTDDATKCENDMFSVCNNGIWGPESRCFNGCDDKGEKCKNCGEAESSKCDNNNQNLISCDEPGLERIKECKNGCDPESKECNDEGENKCDEKDCNGNCKECNGNCNEATGECDQTNTDSCSEGDKKCVDGKEYQCIDDAWPDDNNDDNSKVCQFGCNETRSECNECSEGDIECKDGNLKKCVSGMWKEISCDNGCDSNTNYCKPNGSTTEPIHENECPIDSDGSQPVVKKCKNEKMMKCDGSGKLVLDESCEGECLIVGDKPVCHCKGEDGMPSVEHGGKRCVDSATIKYCYNGEWISVQCPNSENVDGYQELCVDYGASPTYHCDEGGSSGDYCRYGSNGCLLNNNILISADNKNGYFEFSPNNNDGLEIIKYEPACSNGATQCDSDPTISEPTIIEYCHEGKWERVNCPKRDSIIYTCQRGENGVEACKYNENLSAGGELIGPQCSSDMKYLFTPDGNGGFKIDQYCEKGCGGDGTKSCKL